MYTWNNDPHSAYAAHTLNKHRPINNKMSLLIQVNKGPSMNSFEQFYIQLYSYNNKLLFEKCTGEHNPFCQLIHDLQLCYTGM